MGDPRESGTWEGRLGLTLEILPELPYHSWSEEGVQGSILGGWAKALIQAVKR